MAKIEVQLDLIRKYNVPGPRYTSYPTAPHFDEKVSWDMLVPYIKANNDPSQSDVPISLYFHLPFCKSLCWFCGCTNVISQDTSCSVRYLEYLRKELDMLAPLLNSKRKMVQLHFGGGSPTYSEPAEILRLGGWIHELFSFDKSYEASVEVDPRTASEAKIKAFAEIGVNRVSIGVQDLNPEVQKAVRRHQPHELNLRTWE